MASGAFPCPECGGRLAPVLDGRVDEDEAVKLRVRACRDCGHRIGTEERVIDVDDARRRLSALAADRRRWARPLASGCYGSARSNAGRRANGPGLATG